MLNLKLTKYAICILLFLTTFFSVKLNIKKSVECRHSESELIRVNELLRVTDSAYAELLNTPPDTVEHRIRGQDVIVYDNSLIELYKADNQKLRDSIMGVWKARDTSNMVLEDSTIINEAKVKYQIGYRGLITFTNFDVNYPVRTITKTVIKTDYRIRSPVKKTHLLVSAGVYPLVTRASYSAGATVLSKNNAGLGYEYSRIEDKDFHKIKISYLF